MSQRGQSTAQQVCQLTPGPTLGLQGSEEGAGDEASSLVGSEPRDQALPVLLADGACQGWRGRSRDRAATVKVEAGGAWLPSL